LITVLEEAGACKSACSESSAGAIPQSIPQLWRISIGIGPACPVASSISTTAGFFLFFDGSPSSLTVRKWNPSFTLLSLVLRLTELSTKGVDELLGAGRDNVFLLWPRFAFWLALSGGLG
jgi:hypothetical protein